MAACLGLKVWLRFHGLLKFWSVFETLMPSLSRTLQPVTYIAVARFLIVFMGIQLKIAAMVRQQSCEALRADIQRGWDASYASVVVDRAL